MSDVLHMSDEVRAALDSASPIVALESTIISHGFPYPANRECALEAERICREEGATPATIAVLQGRPTIGLTPDEIEHLASADGIAKASRRDLATLVARGQDGATTVAATMILAAAAGIRVFATGGIGGVHIGGQTSLDVSADITELSRTDVVVVCAGAKSILDLPRTLEVLETQGVPVLGFQTDEFPAFYTPTTGLSVDVRLESAEEIADVVFARDALGLRGGVVVANPIPAEDAIDPKVLQEWVDTALIDADRAGIRGKDVTPFLLAELHQASGGATEEANKKLVYNNVRLAAKLAGALGAGL
jgi:pseudouridine-5'-phosphate glycosidase